VLLHPPYATDVPTRKSPQFPTIRHTAAQDLLGSAPGAAQILRAADFALLLRDPTQA
jgi:hypothetical protein